MTARPPFNILVLEARFYDDLSDALFAGAESALENAGATYERVTVPGALELPGALSLACRAGVIPYGAGHWAYHGCVVLGCVIRGETAHFDIVVAESNRCLMDLVVDRAIPLGNGILTVENVDQAWARIGGEKGGKGAEAVHACLRQIDIMCKFQGGK